MKYFEASISQISIRTFAFRRSLGQHSTNLLTGLARRRPLMASPPELDLLTSSGSSCWCCVLLYNKFLSVALIKTQTFTRISWYSLYITYIFFFLKAQCSVSCGLLLDIYIYRSAIITSRFTRANSEVYYVKYVLLHSSNTFDRLSPPPQVYKAPALPKAAALCIPSWPDSSSGAFYLDMLNEFKETFVDPANLSTCIHVTYLQQTYRQISKLPTKISHIAYHCHQKHPRKAIFSTLHLVPGLLLVKLQVFQMPNQNLQNLPTFASSDPPFSGSLEDSPPRVARGFVVDSPDGKHGFSKACWPSDPNLKKFMVRTFPCILRKKTKQHRIAWWILKRLVVSCNAMQIDTHNRWVSTNCRGSNRFQFMFLWHRQRSCMICSLNSMTPTRMNQRSSY